MDILSGILDAARDMKLTLFLYYLFIIALPLYARFRARHSPAFLEKRITKYPEVVSGFYFWGVIWISAFLILNIDIAKLLQKDFPIGSYVYTSIFIAYYALVFYSIYCVIALKVGALKTIKIALVSFPIFRISFQFIFLYLLGIISSSNIPMDIFNAKITPDIKLLIFIDLFWTAPWLITFIVMEDKYIWEPHKKNKDIIFG